MHFSVQPASFEDILPIWKNDLWPGRISPIEPTSAIDSKGEIAEALLSEHVFFWQVIAFNHQVIGVVSAQCTGKKSLRLRGLWVHHMYRKNQIGTALVNQVLQKANELELATVWTMARSSAESFYIKSGFKIVKTVVGYEFGPHTIVQLQL